MDYRSIYGYLALTPAALALGLGLRHSVFSRSYPLLTWVLLGAAAALTYAGALLWARRVPSVISLYLAVILWGITLCLAWQGGL